MSERTNRFYDLRSAKKDNLNLPVEIQLNTDSQFLNALINQNQEILDMSEQSEGSFNEGSDQNSLSETEETQNPPTGSEQLSDQSNAQPSTSAAAEEQNLINQAILEQLSNISNRLDKIESTNAKKTSDKSKIKSSKNTQRNKSATQTVTTPVAQQQPVAANFTSAPMSLTDLQAIRQDAQLQARVDSRLKELADLANTGMTSKLKSQRGGPVEVIVKNRVKWPHEFVLTGVNKERISYDQLSVTQWMAGFGRTVLEESDVEMKNAMIDYMVALMDDATDFSWSTAKASHAVLLCRMEQGEVRDYKDHSKIERIRRANAQKHVVSQPTQFQSHSKKMAKTKTMPCMYYNQGTCMHTKTHETRGVTYRHICATCFSNLSKAFPHTQVECKNKSRTKNE